MKVVKFHSVTSLRPFQIQKAMYYLGSLVIDDNGNITDTSEVSCEHMTRRICVTEGDDEMLSYCRLKGQYSPEDICAKCIHNKKRKS